MDELLKDLFVAQQEATHILKDASNQQMRYKYVSAEKILQECKAILAKHNLMIVRHSSRCDGPIRPDSPGTVSAKFDLVHIDGLKTTTWSLESSHFCIDHKGMPWDKSGSAVLTQLTSYVLIGLLALPRLEHEPTIDARDDSHYVPKKSANTAHTLTDVEALTKGAEMFQKAGVPLNEVTSYILYLEKDKTEKEVLEVLRSDYAELQATESWDADHIVNYWNNIKKGLITEDALFAGSK